MQNKDLSLNEIKKKCQKHARLSGFLRFERLSLENFKPHYGKGEMPWIEVYQKKEK